MSIVEITGGMLRAARTLTDLSQQELAECASLCKAIANSEREQAMFVPKADDLALATAHLVQPLGFDTMMP
jgi:hypothetical protein